MAVALCLNLAAAVARAQTTAQTAADTYDSSEYLIKAGFIYNFTKLVDWPAGTFPQADSPIVIGILGTDPFGPIMDHVVEGKKINTHPVVVRRLKWGASLKDCNILFISSSEAVHLDDVLKSVKGTPVLTVGEMPGFAEHGGIIGLFLNNDKVRFEVNVDAAKQANLNVSSRLLALAKIVQ